MTTIPTILGAIKMADQWAELSGDTILKLITARFNYHFLDDDAHRAKHRLIIAALLSKLPAKSFSKLPDTELYDLLRKCDWAIETRLDCKPFAYFTHKGVRYYLPAPKFADTTAGELSMANMYYLAYAKPKNADYNAVYDLIATLCRPRKWNYRFERLRPGYAGDDRQEYNALTIDKNARLFAHGLPLPIIMAVLQYFEYLLDEFMKRYTDIFDEDESTKPLFTNGEGWLALLEDVAENGPHGDFEEVFGQNCHTVWMYLRHKKMKADRDREEAERIQEQQNNSF